MSITNDKELGEALKAQKDTIEIEGNLKNKVLKIRATGTIAWAVCIGAIGITVVAILAIPIRPRLLGSENTNITTYFTHRPIIILAIGIAIVSGCIAAYLNKLRSKYYVAKKTDNKLILKKK